MQTFLPYDDFLRSARCLDNKRLGKQRVEAFQILKILIHRGVDSRWRNHPAVLMWKNHEMGLYMYLQAVCFTWCLKGYKDTVAYKAADLMLFAIEKKLVLFNGLPFWFGDKLFHDSHKSNLLRKDFDFYSKYKWSVEADLPYYWPITKHNT